MPHHHLSVFELHLKDIVGKGGANGAYGLDGRLGHDGGSDVERRVEIVEGQSSAGLDIQPSDEGAQWGEAVVVPEERRVLGLAEGADPGCPHIPVGRRTLL